MIGRRELVTGSLAAGLAGRFTAARAAAMPGVTKTTVKIGNTMPYSGPASSYGNIGRTESAYFRMINDMGGIAGHKIDFISLDDGYDPPRTVEDVRRLVEQDKVDFLFQDLGTPTNSAIARYVNHNKVPTLFVGSGASKWADYKHYPWDMGWQPNYRLEAQFYTQYAMKHVKNPRFAVLYQNDDFGKDYPAGVRDVLGKDAHKYIARTASYETTDPTVDSQIVSLQASGANVLIVGAIPKFAAQAIRKVHEIGWKPMFFMTNVSISVGGVMRPAGAKNGLGIISTGYLKDPTDPTWKNDAGMDKWRTFMGKYMPKADMSDADYVFGYGITQTMVQVLRQCNGNFSRQNVMRQAENLHNLEIDTVLPGITLNTSPTDHRPIKAMQFQRWNGETWERFGKLIQATA